MRPCKLDNCKAQRVALNWSITELARRSNTSDLTIKVLEAGGTCAHHVADRICDAMAISRATCGFKDLG